MYVCDSQNFDFENIQLEASSNLKCYPTIDSIIAPSDIHAIAYIHELHSQGKKIPQDVQIIGYDDILMSQFIYPSLSTIHQSSYLMGRYAAELVYTIASQLTVKANRIKLPVHYVERKNNKEKISNNISPDFSRYDEDLLGFTFYFKRCYLSLLSSLSVKTHSYATLNLKLKVFFDNIEECYTMMTQ